MKSVILLLLISGCSVLQPKTPTIENTAPTAPRPTLAIEQSGFGASHQFQVCDVTACTKRTSKVIADIPAPLPLDQLAAAFTPPPVAEPAPAPAEVGPVIVHFAFGSSVLRDDALFALRAFLPDMRTAQRIVVHGYTDDVGSLPLNNALAKRRAVTVKRFLVRNGVTARIIKLATGKCCYIAANTYDDGRALNRRASLEIITKDQS